MKRSVSLAAMSLLLCGSLLAQNQFETTIDKDGGKIFKGVLSRELLQSDTSFKWYGQALKPYTPNALAMAALKQQADSIYIMAFMGTWCEDSHFIIPKFFSLLDASGFSETHVSLIGVDRNKKTLGQLTEPLQVKNVPTLIVMKNGKELGRVVEYGKTGMWDKELGEIINAGK